MLASQVALADAVQRLPDTLALTLSELRRYVKQAVQELLVELSDSDQGVANGIRAFLYDVLPQETLARIDSINCLLVAPANDSLASKLRRCRNATADMFMPGAIVPNTSDVVAESLKRQLNRTLESVNQLESTFRGFEDRTKLWTRASVVDLVAVPITMVLLCVTIALLGFGTGSSIRSCVSPSGTTTNAYKFTGVIMLANAALVMLFCCLALPLLMTMTTTGVLAECYVCMPYTENRYDILDRLSQMAWSLTERSPVFAALTPEVVLTKCAGEGISIAHLRQHSNRTELPYLTMTTQSHVTKHWMLKTTLLTRQNATAGNCKYLHDAVRRAMNLFCYKFLEKHAGVALSLALGLICAIIILPLTLVVSQCFVVLEGDNLGSTRVAPSKEKDASREDLFGGETALASSLPLRPDARNAGPQKPQEGVNCLSMLSKPWRQRLHEIYTEEGVNIYDAINHTSTPSEITSSWTTTETTEYATPSSTSTQSTEEQTRWNSSENTRDTLAFRKSARTGPRVVFLTPKMIRNKYVKAFLVKEPFPKLSSRNTKSRLPLTGKASRVKSLHTINEESSLSSEVPMVIVPSMASGERYLPRALSRRDKQPHHAAPSRELQPAHSHRRANVPPHRPAKVTFREDANDNSEVSGAMRGLHHTYPPTACVHRYDGGPCPCGGSEIVFH
ncbi:hypothetical protein MTO96_040606 [Rhipicephalus appendiculatus]